MSQPHQSSGAIRLSLIIPAYNEETRLARFLESAKRYLERHYPGQHEILVVDDGSRDATAAVAEQLLPSGRVIRLAKNQGKGAAVRAGMLEARGEFRLFADADGATPITEERRLMEAIQRGNTDVAIGSRAATGGVRVWVASDESPRADFDDDDDASTSVPAVWHVRPHRHYIGRVFSWLVGMIVGLRFKDTQCGFKLFRAGAATAIFPRLTSLRYAFDVEILALAQQMGMRVAEIPVRWREMPGSKVRLTSDSTQMFRELFRIRRQLTRRSAAPSARPVSEKVKP